MRPAASCRGASTLTITLTLSLSGKTRVAVSAQNGAALPSLATSSFLDEGHFSQAAKKLGVPCEELKSAVLAFRESKLATCTRVLANRGPISESGFTARLRAIDETDSTASQFAGGNPREVLRDALLDQSRAGLESVVEWTDPGTLSCVDLDCDPGSPYDASRLRVILESFQPRPFAAWVTRSGGLRLCYCATQTFAANEIAAVAYLNLWTSVAFHRLELKHATRRPPGEIIWLEQEFEPVALRRFMRARTCNDPDATEWLASRELIVGRRYDHRVCPVDPSETAKGLPVHIGDRGIFCHVCEAHGVRRGSSRPGFFPYSVFIGGGFSSTLLERCVTHAVHWEHARFICDAKLRVPEAYSELIYRTALKVLHPAWNADAINSVFAAGKNFVRMGGLWTNLNGSAYKEPMPKLSSLPVCAGDRELASELSENFDHSRHGYASLTAVFGCRIFSQHLELGNDNKVLAVVQNAELSSDSLTRRRPSYKRERISIDEAWARLEEPLPGLVRELIMLLVAAKGVAEGDASMPPMIYISGPSGASKSSSVSVAAAICGDANAEVTWSGSIERVRQAILDSKETGSFITFNEVVKEMKQYRRDAGHSMDFVLNLTPESRSHKLYVGSVAMGALPVFIFTDITVPESIASDVQIGRRLVHVRLPRRLDWERSLANSGIGAPGRIRVSSDYYSEACDSVLSHVIDRFFTRKMTFGEIAKALGFIVMSEADEASDASENLCAFFHAVCDAPDLSGTDAVRWKGRGWKKIHPDVDSPLRDAWNLVKDEQGYASRQCDATDWMQVAGTAEPAKLEVSPHGSYFAVRFKSMSNTTKHSYRINEELLQHES